MTTKAMETTNSKQGYAVVIVQSICTKLEDAMLQVDDVVLSRCTLRNSIMSPLAASKADDSEKHDGNRN